ncbi:MAG: Ig-like domain-containing protein [Bacteroidota bacterium]
MKSSLLLVLVSWFSHFGLYAQSVRAKKINLDQTSKERLNQYFTDFQVFEINPLQLKSYFSSDEIASTFLQLEQSGTLELKMRSNQLLSFDYQAASSAYKENYTFQGNLPNGNRVRLTLEEDFIYGYFEQGRQLLFVEPLRFVLSDHGAKNYFIFYKENSVIDRGTTTCAATELEAHRNDFEEHNHLQKSSGCVQVDLAIASDKSMYDRYGSVADVENRNVGIMNNVQGDYDDAFNDEIRFVITEQVVITDNSNPFGTMTNSDISTALATFTNWATFGGFSTSHDLGQLWSAIDFTIPDANGNPASGVVGLAYYPGVCNGNFKYHVLEDFQGTSGLMRTLTSHEIGHNFFASHDDVSGQNIMNSFLSDTPVWSSQSKTEINGHIGGSTCQVGAFALGSCQGSGNSNAQPEVSFVTPEDEDTFSQNSPINVQATASDSDGNIVSIELFLNGYSRGIDDTPPYQWTVQSDFIGQNFLQVVATDNDGGTDQETIAINIVASSNQAPTVSITNPSDGQNFSEGENISVQATASDLDGTIASVELFLDDVSMGVDNAAPYQWSLQNLAVGTYDLEVVATDNEGATDIDFITINVNESSGNCEDDVVIMGDASGTYTASNSIETSGTVNVYNSATFQAGNVVRLKPGFWARAGATFLAEITFSESCAGENVEQRSLPMPTAMQLHPNPTRGFTNVSFSLAQPNTAQIGLYNANGVFLKNVLTFSELQAGEHQIAINTYDLQAGLYYVILRTTEGIDSQKLVVVR